MTWDAKLTLIVFTLGGVFVAIGHALDNMAVPYSVFTQCSTQVQELT